MSDLFSQLGIDWKLLLAQIVNFTILAIVLTKFLYKPIIKTLEERKKRVANDIEKSNELEIKLKEALNTKDEILASARRESEKLIKQTEKNASDLKTSLMKEASEEADKIRVEAKKQIEGDREKTMQELKRELGGLVAKTVEKAIGDVSDKNMQNKMVEDALNKAR
ncbi:MAG: ATP synthase F0 subunit B [Candidatus Taylorbacteria bacterium RIFCSPLOWO2_02_FULL_43_11]|uniref:ATP synthase subunit b n=1 Tax=Candidatus Taylorbacteria bacterium RIFCSPHIGHO2_02_FULL_43_32b TaxID=1802306 RepID=A0A1G2MJQ6_9BACT|nr:MAG: ATP synthase F0 subunit B [Candidatus Taylorbacteria bacterium RIFCSPHIGHO2_01_FULL_43_47]OHA24160.1 MAG: ATP synthase F0 subunit B [Candidatus Taylorbacteria bacterium RIFCSPHIGHO2_02_FULL_43_32b]OHA31073.1 MAG: ATP synthase F0 subunit B [Candidatus Taylorbacteria bacterium RIFCSPLOWO2_01_FULL_43_44]OHA37223.1 MAG: ATP synthase F0 subunit B [Candidatus Taylorbacteria bacterium RIFCSPLOWO2_02_FULL_43_11]